MDTNICIYVYIYIYIYVYIYIYIYIGLDRYKGSETLWKDIKKDRAYRDILRNKSNVALKDKARNLGKNGEIGMGRSKARR
jgi:hypothetical protein